MKTLQRTFRAGTIMALAAVMALAISTAACSSDEPRPTEEPDNTHSELLERLDQVNADIAALRREVEESGRQPAGGERIVSSARADCDQLLRNQLVFQRGASTAGRIEEVIRQIQVQRDDCKPELWNPDVDDSTAIMGCFGGSQPLYTNPLVARIGNLTIPRTLYTGFTTIDTVRETSGRDSDNNILVYWSGIAGSTPADNSKCWLYVSRLNSWDENY